MSSLTRRISSTGSVLLVILSILFVLALIVATFFLVTWGTWVAVGAIMAGNVGFWQIAMLGIALAYYVGLGTSLKK